MTKIGVKKAIINKLLVGSDWTGNNPGMGTKKCSNFMCNLDIPANAPICPNCRANQ